jgi:hypothetical protein
VPESVHVELDIAGEPRSVHAAARRDLQRHARELGFGLAEEGPSTLTYKPRIHLPFLVTVWPWLVRRARGETLGVAFAPAQPGTHVTITGHMAAKRARRANDPEQWSEALAQATR